MDAHTLNDRLIARMLDSIDKYKHKSIKLDHLVQNLETNFDTLDPLFDKSDRSEWEKLWIVLEEAVATGEEEKYQSDIDEAVDKIHRFLMRKSKE